MIKVLLFGAISIINGVASDEKLSQHYDTSVSLEPHESRIPYHHFNLKDGYLWNSNHERQNIVNQKNILPWEHQKHYSDSHGTRHEGYVHYINKINNDHSRLLPIRDDLLTYNYQNPHLQHKHGPDYPNDGYKLSSALSMKIPLLSNYNNPLPYTNELYKSNFNYLDTHLGYRQDPRYDHGNTKEMILHENLNLNNIYSRNHDIGGNLHGNKLNFENIYNPQHSPEYSQYYNTPEELLMRPNNYNPYLARKIDYEYLNHDDPYQHRYLSTKELISGKNNHNSLITKSDNHLNTYYNGYRRSGVHIEQPLPLVKESIYRGTPYINTNLYGNHLNNYNKVADYRLHGTYLAPVAKLPGDVQSPINYHHPHMNHGTGTKYLHHGYSHDNPHQAYRHFKDVAVAVKDLIHQKHIYNNYNGYHAHPRLRHYGRSAHTETVGNLMPHKERPNPYILPEYRRYNFNNEHGIEY